MSTLRLGAIVCLLVSSPSLRAADAPKGPSREQIDTAVADGLRWLAVQQHSDGHWAFVRQEDGKNSAATAFALLALLRARETSDGQPYVRSLDRGIEFLAHAEEPDGGLGRPLQAHAVATLALCDVYTRTGDSAMQRRAQRAVDYIVSSQGPDGGWRYTPQQPGDLESTGWQVLALTTAERADLVVPAATWRQLDRFLDSTARADGGYSYLPTSSATPSMTVVGLFCRHCRGWKPDDPRLEKSLARWKQFPPEHLKQHGIFTTYFTALLLNQRGAEAEREIALVQLSLLEQQEKAREGQIGSWSCPVWARVGFGGTFATPLAVLSLRTADRVERPSPLPKCPLKASEVEALWGDLKAPQVFQAAAAARRLGAGAEQAVPFLSKQLQPAEVDAERIARLIRALESDRFPVRQEAESDLEGIGEAAEPALREALDRKPALDVMKRLERILARTSEAQLHGNPALRAITALEYANTRPARELLQRLANGAAGASLTKRAKAALQRLEKRDAGNAGTSSKQ